MPLAIQAVSTGRIRSNLARHAQVVQSTEERFNQAFTRALARELQRRLVPKMRQATPARTGKAKRGYYVRRRRDELIQLRNRAFYTRLSSFSDLGGFNARKETRKVLKSILPSAIRAAYAQAYREVLPL